MEAAKGLLVSNTPQIRRGLLEFQLPLLSLLNPDVTHVPIPRILAGQDFVIGDEGGAFAQRYYFDVIEPGLLAFLSLVCAQDVFQEISTVNGSTVFGNRHEVVGQGTFKVIAIVSLAGPGQFFDVG